MEGGRPVVRVFGGKGEARERVGERLTLGLLFGWWSWRDETAAVKHEGHFFNFGEPEVGLLG